MSCSLVVTRLTGPQQVLSATGGHPFARGTVTGSGGSQVHGWARGEAVGWLGTDAEERRIYFSVLGPPAAAADLLSLVVDDLPAPTRVTLPRGTAELLPPPLSVTPTDWELLWTSERPPRQPGQDRVHDLAVPPGSAAAREVAALLTDSSPRASVMPDDPAVRGWVGVRDDTGRLIACAADTTTAPGVGHLSSIATRPGLRGRGLGAAVTAELTCRLFDSCDVVTLGMYSDNDAARRMYVRLGYTDVIAFSSGPLRR